MIKKTKCFQSHNFAILENFAIESWINELQLIQLPTHTEMSFWFVAGWKRHVWIESFRSGWNQPKFIQFVSIEKCRWKLTKLSSKASKVDQTHKIYVFFRSHTVLSNLTVQCFDRNEWYQRCYLQKLWIPLPTLEDAPFSH